MNRDREQGILEGKAARIVALAIFAFCVALLVYINRGDLWPGQSVEEVAATNPDYLKCRDERMSHVNKLLADGVIDQARHNLFMEKALSYCQGRFPPGNAPD